MKMVDAVEIDSASNTADRKKAERLRGLMYDKNNPELFLIVDRIMDRAKESRVREFLGVAKKYGM